MRSLTNLTLSWSVDRMLISFDIDFLRYRLLLINSRWIETLCTACSKAKTEKITLKIYTICKALLMYTCSKQRGEIFWNNKNCPIYLHNNNYFSKILFFYIFQTIFFFFLQFSVLNINQSQSTIFFGRFDSNYSGCWMSLPILLPIISG